MATFLDEDIEKYRNNALTNTLILVRAGFVNIKGWVVNNPNASEIFVQVHNSATTGGVTLGTTIPTLAIKVPANGMAVLTDRLTQIPYDLGLVVVATTTESGLTAPASAVSVLFLYK